MNGSRASQSACGPAKRGFDASAHLVICVSTLPNTPAMNAMMMPAIAPPAIYPLASNTPGLLSPSATSSSSLNFRSRKRWRIRRSTSQRTNPPTNTGAEEEMGRYTPTAKASDGMPLNSRTTEIITPNNTKAQGSFASRIPLMMYDISTALGA